MPYELIDHTGDLGIVARAPTLEALFAECARAMFEILAEAPDPRSLGEDRASPRADGTEEFDVPADEPAEALRDFLAELLYRFSAERRMYISFKPGHGKVVLGWQLYDPSRHPLRTELKAVTYHQLMVRQEEAGWRAQVIFDV